MRLKGGLDFEVEVERKIKMNWENVVGYRVFSLFLSVILTNEKLPEKSSRILTLSDQ